MKKWNWVRILFILLVISLVMKPNYSVAASIKLTPEVQLAIKWLKGQFEPSSALPQSYEDPTDAAAWTYDVAVWIIVMIEAGEMEIAKKVTNTMLQLQSDGSWVEGYSIINRSPIVNRKPVGSNAWMGLALCHYFLATKEDEALAGARSVAEWLLGLQKQIDRQSPSYGAIPGGLDEADDLIQWISVEHNADALALFSALSQITGEKKYSDAAKLIANWMITRMWNQSESHFEVGTLNIAGTVNKAFPEHLDTQTWTILAIDAAQSITGFKPRDFNGLPWIHQYETTVNYNGKIVKGFATKTFGPGSQSFWSEGTAGYGLASMVTGDYAAANFYSSQIHLLQTQNGGIPYSVAEDVEQIYPQKWDFNSIAATTWMILLDSGINPFVVIKDKVTHILIVTGTIYETGGQAKVSEKLTVMVQNTNNKMQETDYTGRSAGKGGYVVTLLSIDNPAASVGDIIDVTVTDNDGRILIQKKHPLTPTEVQNSYVQIDLTMLPPWDINKDGVIDILDLVVVGENFSTTILKSVFPNPDVNEDGTVNILDLVLIAKHFGETYSVDSAPAKYPSSQHLPLLRWLYMLTENEPNKSDEYLETRQILQTLIVLAENRFLSDKSKLFQNYPNPFNPETWIPFQLSVGNKVQVTIYSSSGQLIRRVDLGYREAGVYTSSNKAAYWDGRDDAGEKVASGVYFCRIQAGDFSAIRKMTLVK